MKVRWLEHSRRDVLCQLGCLFGGASMLSVTGCSKMLLASGKMLWGDPKQPSEFTNLTKVDLTKGLKTVLVACSTPEAVDSDASSLKLDLVDGITRRLRLNGVKTIDPDRVAEWVDDHGGINSNESELARDFDADYIAWIDVLSFTLREPNSPKLLRGNTTGFIRVYKVDGTGESRMALRVYETEFSLIYPLHQPLAEQSRSARVFQKDYVDHLCDMLAERFYDHRPGSKF